MSKNSDQILHNAVLRCKKAQAATRPFNQKKKIKAGIKVEGKMKELLALTKDDDYKGLTAELEALDNMITNMQKGVLEPLLESIETIERRMKIYQKATKIKSDDSDGGDDDDDDSDSEDIDQSVYDAILKEQEPQRAMPISEKSPEESGDSVKNIQPKKGISAIDKIIDEYNNTDNDNDNEEEGCEITAIQQRFMDRLRNFFNLQKIAAERVGIVDPQGKIAAMNIKPHSKGIKEKDGTYKSGYRQQDVKGNPIRNLSALYIAAKEATPEFQTLMDSLRDRVPGLTSTDIEVAPIKSISRASKKAQEEYLYRQPGPGEAWLYDILRASVYCKSYKQMYAVNKYLKESFHIVDCSNRFAIPQFDGYRDLIYYVSVPCKNGHAFICEIQVHNREFNKYFGVNSHRTYLRPYIANETRDSAALLRDLDMLLQVGRVDENLMEFLVETTDPSQLKLFARIFADQLGETKRALELFKEVLTMEESTYGKGNIITGSTYLCLGRALLKIGEPDGSILYLRQAISVFTTNFGSEHPVIATTLVIIGEAHSIRGDFAEALAGQQKALQMRKECLGEDHILVGESHLSVAKAQCDQGEFKKGLAECHTALTIQESILGENDIEVIRSHCMIGAILFLQGENKNAIEAYNNALSIQEDVYGKKHQMIADTLTEIGKVKMKEKEYDEGETYHRKALNIRKMILGKNHSDCAISIGNIGITTCRRGDKEGALALLRLSLKIRTRTLGRNHLLTSDCYADIASVMAENDDIEDALIQYKECLVIRKRLYGTYHPKVAETMNAIGGVQTRKGDHSSALSSHSKALKILEKVVGSSHPDVADTYELLGDAHESQMNHTQALDYHSMALAIRSEVDI
ncbi:MAG: tetratricopeptide (TPR) repeat protein [Bacillariaceae sp.]|jgi:tetratricopeptide (TPR) repeat protein